VGTGDTDLPVIVLTSALPSVASAVRQVVDISADVQVPNFVTSLVIPAGAGSTTIRVPSVGSMGFSDTLQITLDNGAIHTTQISSIQSPGNPQIYLDYSKDGGFTFSTPQLPRSLGQGGQYLTRLRWLRLGQAREWYFRLTIIDPVKRVIIGAYADMYVGM
jgi:hypothetical protein